MNSHKNDLKYKAIKQLREKGFPFPFFPFPFFAQGGLPPPWTPQDPSGGQSTLKTNENQWISIKSIKNVKL